MPVRTSQVNRFPITWSVMLISALGCLGVIGPRGFLWGREIPKPKIFLLPVDGLRDTCNPCVASVNSVALWLRPALGV